MQMPRWPLATKLLAIGGAFLVLALGSIALTLWVSWQLEGGAAAVNEAGRMRMQSYRLALTLNTGADRVQLQVAADALDASLERLRTGDPSRPLFVPWNQLTRERFDEVRLRWQALRPAWTNVRAPVVPPPSEVDDFVARIDAFVSAIEQQLSDTTAVLRGVQLTLVALAIASTVAFFYTGHLFVLDPLQRFQTAVARIRDDDFSARVDVESHDEFGQLASAFNTMASHLQGLYLQLEAKVTEKTERLEDKRARLAALYEVSAFIAKAETLPQLADGFAHLVRRIAHADGVAVRWSDEANERYLMLAADGLPATLAEQEQCLQAGGCHCGQPAQEARIRVIPIVDAAASSLQPSPCSGLGYRTLVSVPVTLHQRVLGEVDLFFRRDHEVDEEERSLYDTLASHLAGGMESLRAAALQKEAAVAQERTLLAQELHDSIAQSLAFLKLQVGLLRQALKRNDAQALNKGVDELEAGVRESYGDVRELLLHFRTRAKDEDIGTALRTTLQKFEHQSGVHAELQMQGHGLPLPADVQIQVLHILQEALSNVRKHARAGQVVLRVQQAPVWRFEVVDDGRGFDPGVQHAETHVGLRIMRERAARIGARVDVSSTPGEGTRVQLSLDAAPAALTSEPAVAAIP